uniref:DUF2085 domain-containing protein n=1 Tax=uncultured Poseidoniia archaeon TaxID=1697135 RepID=A0A1B1TB80_9ARCH|nr:hypothetical protein [uncultured Candidatus Thalassoarchaea sp.]
MEKNGLPDRNREKKVGMWIFGIFGFFFVSFFLSPTLLPSGTVPELEARANALDYMSEDGKYSSGNHGEDEKFAWTNLDPYSAFIYAFGDFNCHMKHERSWEINGNQMPVCTRDVGMFFGIAVGGLIFSRRGYNRWTVKDTCLSLFPDNWLEGIYRKNYRTYAWLITGTIFCLPLIFDGFTQLLTSYESNNLTRPLTGIAFGIGFGILVGAAYSARPKFFKSANSVSLPSGSKFELKSKEEE